MIVDEGNAWNIHGVYAKAERAILDRVKKYLADGLEVPEYQLLKLSQVQALRAEAFEIFKLIQPTVAQSIQDGISKTYREANLSAYADIGKGLTPEKLPPLQAQAAIRNLNNEVTQAIASAESRILRQVEDTFREAVGDVTRQVLARGTTRNDAVINVVDRLEKQGIGKFTDQAGRNWNLPNYAEMSVRTGTRKALITGYEDVLDKNDLDLVMVQPGPRACSICDRWARTVLTRETKPQSLGGSQVQSMISDEMITVEIDGTLSDARADGFQHPNCRCRLRVYLPGITDPKSLERPPWDEDGYKAQQVQRQLESEIRKAKSEQLRAGSDDTNATNRLKTAQDRLKAHLAENPDLKRQSAREQISGRLGTTTERQILKDVKNTPKPPKTPKTEAKKTADQAKQNTAQTFAEKGDGRAVADLSKLKRIDDQKSMADESMLNNPGNKIINHLKYNGTQYRSTYDNNCSLCVNSLEMRVRGYDVIAKPIGGGFGRYREQTALDWVDKDGNVRGFTALESLNAKTTVTRLREYSKDLPVGARGFISGQYKKGGGHIFNWEMTENGLVFHEGQVASIQSGVLSKAYDGTAGSTPLQMQPSTLAMLRVDDLQPSNQMIRQSIDERTPDRLSEIEAERANPSGAQGIRTSLNAARTSLTRLQSDLVAIKKQIDALPNTLEFYDELMRLKSISWSLPQQITDLEKWVAKLENDLRKAQL